MKKGVENKKHPFLRAFLQIILGVFDAALVLSILGFVMLALMYRSIGNGDIEHDGIRAQTSKIYDRTGKILLYEIHGEENRTVIGHDQIPDVMRLATIAAEDDSFYHHFGVDPASIIRAAKANIQQGGVVQGGSTITQQLVRNVFLTRDRTFERKIKEALLAIKIERKYSKDQILDYYLNEVPYGSNSYGIQAAAQTFFGKDAAYLTLDEAAFLAALPKAPTYFSPYGNHRGELMQRQKYILSRMKDLELTIESEIVEARRQNTFTKIMPFRENIIAPHFVMYVKERLEKQYGVEEVESGGFIVTTSLDVALQKDAEKIIAEGAVYNEKRFNGENAAMVAIDPKSGEILAMVGSRDYFDTRIDGQVNVALRPRQPGSSFKPIVYGNAFERGYQPETILFDVPTNFGPDGSGCDYVPQNYDGKFHGMLSMRQTLAMSLNVPAVQTLYLGGIDNMLDFAKRLGVTTLNERERYGLSLALGGGDVRLLELTGAFSVYANDGKKNSPDPIISITVVDGKKIYEHENVNEQVIDPQVARKIDSILSDNAARTPIFGPNSPLILSNKTVAAKTGTTQDFKDAWTVGFTPSIAIGVWTGNNDSRVMKPGSDGVFVAAPIWNKLMARALDSKQREYFADYERVDTKIALLAGAPATEKAFFNKKTGKQLSEKKVAKTDESKLEIREVPIVKHSILYYVNKDNPLSELGPNFEDPMVMRWERALQSYTIPSTEQIAGASTQR